MRFLSVLVGVMLFVTVNAQDCGTTKVLEPSEYYPIEPLPQLEVQDVMWHRRLWREIDLSEKMNELLYFSSENDGKRCCLFDLLNKYIGKGIIKAYNADNDRFTTELSLSQLDSIAGDSIEENGVIEFKSLDTKDILKIWLKEDWFYNAKYARIEVRIIGICPVKVVYDKNKNVKGYKQLFWLYFPHIRGILASYEAVKKDKEEDRRVSYDDVFMERMFNSYIIIREKDMDKHVTKNKTELDIRLEREKSKQYYSLGPKGLWSY